MHRVSQAMLVSLLVLAMALSVGCGSGDTDGIFDSDREGGVTGAATQGSAVESSAAEPAGAPKLPDAVSAGQADDALDGAVEGPSDSLLQSSSRSVVYVGRLVVIVEDVKSASEEAKTAIAGLGGLLFGQDTITEPLDRSVLTFRVPPTDFDEALRRLAGLGDLDSQQVNVTDVTERVVDLESRIITAEASVERLRMLLSAAVNLDDVAQLERELLQRETDLELLRGQLRTVESQVALATITVTLTTKEPPEPEAAVQILETAYEGRDAGDGCPEADELEVVEGVPVTVCLSIENMGNLILSAVTVREAGLDLRDRDFVVLEGDLVAGLKPGEQLLGYFDWDAERGMQPRPVVSATALDEDGNEVRIGIDTEVEPLELLVLEDTSIPGFGDGVAASWWTLVRGAEVVVLLLGVAVPFLWVVPIVGVGVWWIRRISEASRSAPASPASNEQEDNA